MRIDPNLALHSWKLHALVENFRAAQWWEHKIVPIIGMFYATSLMLDAPLAPSWLSLLTLLFALVPGAAYVSALNDFTDRAEDLAAGKANRLLGRSRGAIVAFIAIPVAVGLLFMLLWRNDALLLLFYVAAWVSFSLYSLPPLRLKTRGLAGVLADAAGAHLFPTLVAVVLAFRALGRPVDVFWLVIVAVWAMAYGLRGILWHQLSDIENDRLAGVTTFAQRHPPETLAALAKFIVLPLELISFSALLWRLDSALPEIALALYALMVVARVQWLDMHATIIDACPRFLLVMREYYGVYFPVAVLLASALRYPTDLIILSVQLLLFPRAVTLTVLELYRVLHRAKFELRHLPHRSRLLKPQKR